MYELLGLTCECSIEPSGFINHGFDYWNINITFLLSPLYFGSIVNEILFYLSKGENEKIHEIGVGIRRITSELNSGIKITLGGENGTNLLCPAQTNQL